MGPTPRNPGVIGQGGAQASVIFFKSTQKTLCSSRATNDWFKAQNVLFKWTFPERDHDLFFFQIFNQS